MILVGTTGGRCCGVGDLHPAAVAGDQLVALADDLDDGAVEQDAAVLGMVRLMRCALAGRRAAGAGPAVGGAVEPEVDLAGADRSSRSRCTSAAGRDARLLAERADHHQVVAEMGLGLVLSGTPAWCRAPGRGRRLSTRRCVRSRRRGPAGVKMCAGSLGLVVAQLAQRPEGVRERAGGDQQHLAVRGRRCRRASARPSRRRSSVSAVWQHADARPSACPAPRRGTSTG